jgi:DNA-binding response OmpR family regulator
MTAVTVLLADGDLDCRVIYGTMLQQRGFRVLLAADGEEAVRRAREDLPGVLVLETSLPYGWLRGRRPASGGSAHGCDSAGGGHDEREG